MVLVGSNRLDKNYSGSSVIESLSNQTIQSPTKKFDETNNWSSNTQVKPMNVQMTAKANQTGPTAGWVYPSNISSHQFKLIPHWTRV